MSPAHKQRVIGAAVLVALGLIIVPAVLDFSRDERTDMKGMEIPAGPDVMQMEVLPLDEWSQKLEPGVERQEGGATGEAGESGETPETTPDQLDSAPQRSEPKPAPVAKPRESHAAPTVPVTKSAPVPVATPKAATVAAGEGWVVQVASLAVEAKANALRDQLRKAGHPAFVERSNSGGNSHYRVKVGPVAQRAEADALKAQIKQNTRLDGLVMRNQ